MPRPRPTFLTTKCSLRFGDDSHGRPTCLFPHAYSNVLASRRRLRHFLRAEDVRGLDAQYEPRKQPHYNLYVRDEHTFEVIVRPLDKIKK